MSNGNTHNPSNPASCPASCNQNRRRFLRRVSFGFLWAAPVLTIGERLLFKSSFQAHANKEKLVMVKESEPQPKALGYLEDASKVDVKKWSKRAGPAGQKQFCYNCMFYQTKSDPKTTTAAPCTIFANKGVTAKGWCNSWTQNPKVSG